MPEQPPYKLRCPANSQDCTFCTLGISCQSLLNSLLPRSACLGGMHGISCKLCLCFHDSLLSPIILTRKSCILYKWYLVFLSIRPISLVQADSFRIYDKLNSQFSNSRGEMEENMDWLVYSLQIDTDPQDILCKRGRHCCRFLGIRRT